MFSCLRGYSENEKDCPVCRVKNLQVLVVTISAVLIIFVTLSIILESILTVVSPMFTVTNAFNSGVIQLDAMLKLPQNVTVNMGETTLKSDSDSILNIYTKY